jgi:transposase InsO family protein
MPDPAHVGQALGSMTSSPTPGIHATPMQWMTQADLLSRISDISSGGTPVQLAGAAYDPNFWVAKGWEDVFPPRVTEYFDVLPHFRQIPHLLSTSLSASTPLQASEVVGMWHRHMAAIAESNVPLGSRASGSDSACTADSDPGAQTRVPKAYASHAHAQSQQHLAPGRVRTNDHSYGPDRALASDYMRGPAYSAGAARHTSRFEQDLAHPREFDNFSLGHYDQVLADTADHRNRSASTKAHSVGGPSGGGRRGAGPAPAPRPFGLFGPDATVDDIIASAMDSSSAFGSRYQSVWLMDTGCNQPVAHDPAVLGQRKPVRIALRGVGKEPVYITEAGTVQGMVTDINGEHIPLQLENVGLTPGNKLNLLAVSELAKGGAIFHIERGNSYLLLGDERRRRRVPIQEQNGLYILRLEHYVQPEVIRSACRRPARARPVRRACTTATSARQNPPQGDQGGTPNLSKGQDLNPDPLEGAGSRPPSCDARLGADGESPEHLAAAATMNLFHRRLNHMDPKLIRVVYDRGLAEGWKLPKGKFTHDAKCQCPACRIARATQASTPKSRRFDQRTHRPFARVQVDLKGPLPMGFGGFRFSCTFICESSRYSHTYFLRKKGDTSVALAQFLDDIRLDGYAPPAEIRSDQGSEFYVPQTNIPAGRPVPLSKFSRLCLKHNIRHRVAPPYNSTLNGMVERAHRSLHEAANAYLYDSGLSPVFWCMAVKHAEYVKNRIPHSALGLRTTPYQVVHLRRPRYDRIKVFGCDMFEFMRLKRKIPGAAKARKLIYIGVPTNGDTGYLGFDIKTRTIRVAYDVTFDEDFANRRTELTSFDSLRQDIARDVKFDDMLDADSVRTLFSNEPVLPKPISSSRLVVVDGPRKHRHVPESDSESDNQDDGAHSEVPCSDSASLQEEQGRDDQQPDDVSSTGDVTEPAGSGGAQTSPPPAPRRPPPSASSSRSVPSGGAGARAQPKRATHRLQQIGDSLARLSGLAHEQDLGSSWASGLQPWVGVGSFDDLTSTTPASAALPRTPASAELCADAGRKPLTSTTQSPNAGWCGGGQGVCDPAPAHGASGRRVSLPPSATSAPAQHVPSSNCAVPRHHSRDLRWNPAVVGNATPVPSTRPPGPPNPCPHGHGSPTSRDQHDRHGDQHARSRRRKGVPGRSKSYHVPTADEHNGIALDGIYAYVSELRAQAASHGPLRDEAVQEYLEAEERETSSSEIRPLRLEQVGQVAQVTEADRAFLKTAEARDFPVAFVMDIPKRDKTESWSRYKHYRMASTLKEMIVLSVGHRHPRMSKAQATQKARADILNDYARGYIVFPANESNLDGHFVDGTQLARQHKHECHAQLVRYGLDSTLDWDDTAAKIAAISDLRSALTSGSAPAVSRPEPGAADQEEQPSSSAPPPGIDIHASAEHRVRSRLHENFLELHHIEDTLKFLENPDTLKAFVAHELGRQALFDPLTNSSHYNPKNDKEATQGPDKDRWAKARREEMDALEKFGTYKLVTHTNGRRPMTSRFVDKLKTDDQGRISRWKSRLVARGFLSREGIEHDADELFSPVLSYDSFRTILAVAADRGWRVRQIDISNAYLQGRLVDSHGRPREIYMEDPLGRVDPRTGKKYFLKLLKPLYGLKQSGRLFCNELHTLLLDNGFKRMPTDSCLFKLEVDRRFLDKAYKGPPSKEIIMVGTYVDDLTFSTSSDLAADYFQKLLRSRFTINERDTGDIHYMLGVRIRQDLDNGTISMDQTAAIEALAKKFDLDNSPPSRLNATPMTLERLDRQSQTTDTTGFQYLSAVGSLLHIAQLTRPDIAYAVGVCSRHSSAYGPSHVRAVQRVIKYLYHTRHHGIVYRHHSNSFDPTGHVRDAALYEAGRRPNDPPPSNQEESDPSSIYADADFAGDSTKRSTSGNIIFLSGGPITWSSRLQKLYALSTAEAEIYSLTEALKDAAFLKLHLHSLGVREDKPIPVYEDNSACRIMSANELKTYSRARHYVTRLGFAQDMVGNKTVDLLECPTSEMIADALTKPLTYDEFRKYRDVMVHDVSKLPRS